MWNVASIKPREGEGLSEEKDSGPAIPQIEATGSDSRFPKLGGVRKSVFEY